jgi:hypothetical protein
MLCILCAPVCVWAEFVEPCEIYAQNKRCASFIAVRFCAQPVLGGGADQWLSSIKTPSWWLWLASGIAGADTLEMGLVVLIQTVGFIVIFWPYRYLYLYKVCFFVAKFPLIMLLCLYRTPLPTMLTQQTRLL